MFIGRSTIIAEPLKNTIIIIENKMNQDHELNRASSPSPMSQTISLRDHFRTATKMQDRLGIIKNIKVNKTF